MEIACGFDDAVDVGQVIQISGGDGADFHGF
jgi:hypothetical protein